MKFIINIIFLIILGITTGHAQTLDEYFRKAVENNPGLQSKHKEFEAALQKIPQVSSLPDPTFSFSYNIPKMMSQSAEFSLMQTFPWFGTLKAQGNAAALMAEAQYESFLDARNQLYYEVSAAYYPLYELNRLREIEQKNIDILESYKSIANSKFKNGVAPMVDVLRVDIMLKDAVTNLNILEKKEKPLKTTFNKLLNRDVNEEVIIDSSLAAEHLQDSFRRDSLLGNNPMLNALDLKVKASEASEIAAQKQGLPKLGVGLDYAIMEGGKNIVMPMVSVSIPIFRKKYKAAEREAQLMQESYSLQKDEIVNLLTSNYEMTWFQIQQQKELIDLYEQQTRQTNQSLNLLFSAYSNSGKDFEEVLRMQQQLLKYEKMKATAEVEYQTALAKLNYITAFEY
ncbi:MAG: TolC family protein [Dysgonamonadaceae bacterium]|nr:TolC family protein [Dysgonamonadaceae bacterium]